MTFRGMAIVRWTGFGGRQREQAGGSQPFFGFIRGGFDLLQGIRVPVLSSPTTRGLQPACSSFFRKRAQSSVIQQADPLL
jgi:hypothetical protein